jgi:hypothetical protein
MDRILLRFLWGVFLLGITGIIYFIIDYISKHQFIDQIIIPMHKNIGIDKPLAYASLDSIILCGFICLVISPIKNKKARQNAQKDREVPLFHL